MTAHEWIVDLLIVLTPVMLFIGVVFVVAVIESREPTRFKDDQ